MTPPHRTVLALGKSFERVLLAENKSPRTVQTYGEAIMLLGAYLQANDFPTDTSEISAAHVRAFITELLERHKPATASNRYRARDGFSAGPWRRAKSRTTPWPG